MCGVVEPGGDALCLNGLGGGFDKLDGALSPLLEEVGEHLLLRAQRVGKVAQVALHEDAGFIVATAIGAGVVDVVVPVEARHAGLLQ